MFRRTRNLYGYRIFFKFSPPSAWNQIYALIQGRQVPYLRATLLALNKKVFIPVHTKKIKMIYRLSHAKLISLLFKKGGTTPF